MEKFNHVAVYCRSFPDGGFSHITFLDPNQPGLYTNLKGADIYEIAPDSSSHIEAKRILDGIGVRWLPGHATGTMSDLLINGKPAAPGAWNPPK
jgi:hypothetical protein